MKNPHTKFAIIKNILFVCFFIHFLNLTSQTTIIPDNQFELFLEGQGLGNGIVGDNEVLTASISTVTYVGPENWNITDLTGIEDFTALENLNVRNNQLTNLDISNNLALTTLSCENNQLTNLILNTGIVYLYCNGNQLTNLDLSSRLNLEFLLCHNNPLTNLNLLTNPNLTTIVCSNNLLTNLNTSQNPLLYNLDARDNQITTLDFSQNGLLGILRVNNNQLTDLDLSLNTNLTVLESTNNLLTSLNVKNGNNSNITNSYFKTTSNTNLNCITVDNESYSSLNWANIDVNSFFSDDCSQLTNIPDTNFEQALIDLGYDFYLNNYVSTTTINAITNLSVQSKNINDLTGIEDFTVLETLNVAANTINSINLSQNSALTSLHINNNLLTSLDLSQNTNLLWLNCRDNVLQNLDVSLNTSLFHIECNFNELTSLDLSQNTALTSLRCNDNFLADLNLQNGNNSNMTSPEFNINNNPNLSCILVDNPNYSNTTWSNNNANAGFSTDCTTITNIPDANFEQVLIDINYDFGTVNGSVYTTNINTKGALFLDNKNIADLTGIQDFSALQALVCSNNQLTTLDLSQNNALTLFDCNTNALTSLNVKNGINTSFINFTATNNPNLVCIDVDDANYSTTNWTNIDAQTSFSENCALAGQTYLPDNNFEQALIDLGYDTVLDDYVLTANINSILSLNINNKNISDLTGIEDFSALQSLICNENNLTSLDVTQNLQLLLLTCHHNQLTAIDLSQNTLLNTLNVNFNQLTSLDVSLNLNLIYLHCRINQLTSIDLSQNLILEEFICILNPFTALDLSLNHNLKKLYTASCSQLTSLNVKNGNNTNVTFFNASNNLNLTCIEVDDAVYSTANWTDIDAQTSFNENCHYDETYVPDNNFEQALIDLGYDTVIDDYVFTALISSVTNLDVSHSNIADLTGIEDFTALQVLDCSVNSLTNLDLSNNLALNLLKCNNNQFLSLDFSQNALLGYLDCNSSTTTSININQNTDLYYLDCGYNNLTNLDVSQNSNLLYLNSIFNNIPLFNISQNILLEELIIGYNPITSIDLSQNLNLTGLFVGFAQLTSLNLSQNTALENFFCGNNQLVSLNVKNGNNTNIVNFDATNNTGLTCIEVDDAIWSTTNWTTIDPASSFSDKCQAIWYDSYWSYTPEILRDAIIKHDYDTNLQGSFSARYLTIDATKTVIINANNYIKVDANFINNGNLIIENTGSFVQINDLAAVAGFGTFTTKIETTPLVDQSRFTYFSSPVQNETLNVFNSWANMAQLYSFDESIQDWQLDNATTSMTPIIGFAVAPNASSTFPFNAITQFNGKFNNGEFTVPLTFNPGGINDDNILIGNPYPSAISAADLLNGSTNANAFYFWTHNSTYNGSQYASDDYAIWNNSGGIASQSGSPAPIGFIASGQGFFVDAVGTGNLVFNNAMRVTGNNDDFRTPNHSENDKIWLNLTNDDGLFNQILINFTEEGTLDFDTKLDATRFNTGNPISFYSNGLNQEYFAIQAMPILSNEDIIPLGFSVIDETISNLKISIDHLENFENYDIYLKDNLLNITHDLQLNDYEFSITEANEFNNRFELILNRSALNTQDDLLTTENLIITNYSENEIKIRTRNSSIIKELKIYDVLGKLVIDLKPNKSEFIINTNLNQGIVLFIKAELENGQILYKQFIKF